MRSVCDVCEAAPAHLFCAADEAALCPKCDEKIDFVEYVGFCELCIEIAKSRETYPGEENLTKPYTVVGLKVHACNKLASRHVRLQLAEARAVPVCDICEKASAFFFCGIDGTSLCLQCDMDVHTGGKKAHERYLLMAQRVELPVQKPGRDDPADKQPGNNDGTHKQSGQANNGQNHVHHHHHHHHHHHRGQENKNERVITKLGANSDNSIGPAVAIAVGTDVPQSMADKQPASQMFDLNSQPQRSQIQASHPDEDEDGDRQPVSSDNNHSDVVQGMTAKKG